MNENNFSNKQISINMLANIVSYSANLIVAFILTPFLIQKIGKETYSFYPMANTIVNYMAILMTSMNAIASRFVMISLVKGDKKEADRYFSSTLIANITMGTIMAIPMLFIVLFIDKVMNVPINSVAAVRTLFVLLFSSSLINIISSVFGIATFAKNRIDLRSVRELIIAIVKLGLYVFLYWLLPPSIIYIGIVILVVGLLNLFIQIYYTRILLPDIKISSKYFSIQHIKVLFVSSCWTAINSFGNQLLVGMSLVMANMFYGADVSGLYSIVNTVPQFLSGVISMMVGVFYPIVTHSYVQDKSEDLVAIVNKSQNFVGVFGCSIATVFAAVSPEFYLLWMPGENARVLSELTYIIIIPYYFIACMWTITNLNIIMNKVKIPALFTLGVGCLNIIASYLMYFWKIGGITNILIISTILQIIWIGWFIPKYVCKHLRIKSWLLYKPLVKSIPCSICSFVLINILKRYFNICNSWGCFLLFGCLVGCMTICIYAVVMFGMKYLCKIVKNKDASKIS